jgi:peroxiredoxin
MCCQIRFLSCILSLSFLYALSCVPARADGPGESVGKAIADFTLRDTAGQEMALSAFKDKKTIVVVFLGTQCPINNYFMPRLNELHKEFADKGVQFLAINPNIQDTPQRIAEHAKKHKIAFPLLRDESNKTADNFGARRTPEAFVLDDKRVIRYQGRIDDQYGIDIQRPAPTRRDLAEAVNEVLAGKKVSVAATPVAGCLIGRVKKNRPEGDITYTKHIASILQNNCQECHRPGQIGPMALQSYDDVTGWADMIREVVSDRRMPPWYADPKHGKWANDRSLKEKDFKQLLAWIENGMPRGPDADLPPPRKFPDDEWKIGKPDVILHMPKEFDVPAAAKGGVPYQHIRLANVFDEDKWIERAEARAGAAEVVHHIILFIEPPGTKFFPGNPETPVLCGMAPGDLPMLLKPGTAKMVPKGSSLIFQMHYTPNGKAQKDRSYVGVIFAKKPPERVITTKPIFNAFFKIPKGADNHEVVATHTFKEATYIDAFMPHMHLRGKDFLYRADYPDGKKETLLYVPRYNFYWQSAYRPVQPVAMPAGSKLICIAHFDNSKNNPNNPDPDRVVTWGDQTWQEMMIGWIDISHDRVEFEAKSGKAPQK